MKKEIYIRNFTEDDIDFAVELIRIERWNYLPVDIKRLLEYEPNGCFVAEKNNKRVGFIFTISYDRALKSGYKSRIGWIALLIIHPTYRRRGIGTALTKHAMDYLYNIGANSIWLHSDKNAVRFYQKLGFEILGETLRLKMKSEALRDADIFTVEQDIDPLNKDDLEKIAQFDALYFGANRLEVLKRLYRDYPHFCYVARSSGKIIGYIMSRKNLKGYSIGPFICHPKYLDIARSLLCKCLASMLQRNKNFRITIDVPSENLYALSLLLKLGFQSSSKTIRMCYGERGHFREIKSIFAFGGLEKG
mgnify:CR=1 FL=1